MGWAKFSPRATFSLIYTPSYTGRVRYSSWNALNHALSLSATRNFAPRWSYNFSANADLSTQEATLFAPTAFGNVASVPASFNDLAAALLSAKFNNPELAAALSSAPTGQSPVRNLLYGTRMLTAVGQASFSYSYSPRLSFTFGGGGSRIQHVADTQAVSAQGGYLLPDTTSGNANLGFSYSLSPLTQLGGTVATSRISSALYETQTTTSLATLGRTFSRRWLLQLHGGVGITNPLRQAASSPISTKPRPAFGASLAFKTYSHTLLGSFDRTVSDSYGVGASTSSVSTASWRWQRPARVWWLESSFSWEQLQLSGQDTTGWRSSVGVGRSVGAHLAVFTQYAYLDYSGRFQNFLNKLSQSAVRVSLVWTPRSATAR